MWVARVEVQRGGLFLPSDQSPFFEGSTNMIWQSSHVRISLPRYFLCSLVFLESSSSSSEAEAFRCRCNFVMETFMLGGVESGMKDVEMLWCYHALAFSVYAVDTCYS